MSDIDHAPELREGAAGDWVKYLQQLLVTSDTSQHRWPVSIDSKFGAGTVKAVRAFQAWVPLPVTGFVDQSTWEALLRNAQVMEQVDETMGQISGDERAGRHGHKLDVGAEVGHKGWKCANVRFVVRDFKGELHNGFGYARFTDPQGAESDEQAQVDDGSLILSQVWIPNEGNLTLYLSAIQGGVTQLEGAVSFAIGGDLNLSFGVQQQSHTKTVSRSEAEGYGWTHGSKVEVGVDFEVISAGGEVSSEHSGNWTLGSEEEITVRLPLAGLEMAQTG
jgi:hypothetical protein